MSYFFSLLGGFDCRNADGSGIEIASRKARALLAYLLVNGHRAIERDYLANLFWEDSGATQARANLRKTLSRLRQAVPQDLSTCLVTDNVTITFLAESIDSDIHQFERFANASTPETLEQANALYQGEFLSGLNGCGALFEDWATSKRRSFDELSLQVLQRLLEHYVMTGAIDRAIQIAIQLLGRDPLQENIHRQLIQLYLQQDRIGSALEQYRRCKDVLARELGISPAAETERLRTMMQQLVPEEPAPANYPLNPESDNVPERSLVIQSAADARHRHKIELAAKPSIAVLCFTDSENNTHEQSNPFSLGASLAEDLATTLGRFRELNVIAPSTAFAYCNVAATPAEVGLELGVSYICEGHIRRLNQQLKMTTCLIESQTGRQVWAENFNLDSSGLLELQNNIVRQIGSVLIGRIESAWLEKARRKPPQNWQAYDYWLRGRSALRRPGLTAIEQARRYFQQALARDPEFARAYVGLAMAQLNEWGCFSWNHWVFVQKDALELANKAVELDEQDHQAHCILGMTQLYQSDYEGAQRRLLYAIELNPNDTDVLAHAAAGLALVGDHDHAVDAGRRALRLSPHHPEWYTTFVGIALFAAREYEEAIATMATAPEAICNTPAFIAACYAHLGQSDRGKHYRDTVQRHYQLRLARGTFTSKTSCVDWLLAMDPFQYKEDLEHYAAGLREAGFE